MHPWREIVVENRSRAMEIYRVTLKSVAASCCRGGEICRVIASDADGNHWRDAEIYRLLLLEPLK